VPNSKIIADAYARAGFTTLVPNLFTTATPQWKDYDEGKLDVQTFIKSNLDGTLPRIQVHRVHWTVTPE
jgi:hypothetical protein